MIEEREELMVPLSSFSDCNTAPELRKAHFLKPILDPCNQSLPKPPSFSVSPKCDIKKLKGNLRFYGRPTPNENWLLWVGSLQEIHQCTWKEVGIFDAIRASTYKLKCENELVIRLAENWCPETNTFVFPWGECTITLEDIMILGGYSVLGRNVNSSFDPVCYELGNELIHGFKKTTSERGNHNGLLHSDWMDYFMNIGGELEHMAFLALWLSKFVFPSVYYCEIYPYIVPLAVALAKGTKIALAPAVLASIYRDLCLLKEKIVSIVDIRGCSVSKKLILYAPFQIVQLWAWERFPTLRPKPITLVLGEPRLARWQKPKKRKDKQPYIMEFETLGEGFLWRPYALPVENWESREFYSDEERLVVLNSDVKQELLTFARCLRSCELVGFDCIEQYLPQRVARQFGLDQGIPSSTPRSNSSMELACGTYDIPFDNVPLYLSPRLFKGDVSVGYFDWYKLSFNHSNTSLVACRRRRKLSNIPVSKMNLKRRKKIGGIQEDNTELSPDCSTSLHGVPLASCSVSAGEMQSTDVVAMLSCDKNSFDNSEFLLSPTLHEVPITISHETNTLTEQNIAGVPCLDPSCHFSVISPTLIGVATPTRSDLNTEKNCFETAPYSKNASCSVSPKSPTTKMNIRPQKLDGSEKNYTETTLPRLNSFNAAMDSGLIDSIADMCVENNVLNERIAKEPTPSPTQELVVKKANRMDSQIEDLDDCEKHCGNNTSGNKWVTSVTEMHNEAVPSFHKSISPSKNHDNSCQNIPTQCIQMGVVNEVVSSIDSTMKDISNKHSVGAQPSAKPWADVPSFHKSISPSKNHDNIFQDSVTQSIQIVVVNKVGRSTTTGISDKYSVGAHAQPSVKPLVEDDENVSKVDCLMEPNMKKKICLVSAHVEEEQAAKYGNAKLVKGSMDEPVIISDDDHDNDDEDDGEVGDVNLFAERESKLERRIDKLRSIISRLNAAKLRSKE